MVDPLTTENIIGEITERGKKREKLLLFLICLSWNLEVQTSNLLLVKNPLKAFLEPWIYLLMALLLPDRVNSIPLSVYVNDHWIFSCAITNFCFTWDSKDRAPLQTSFYNNLKGQLKERLDPEEKDLYMKHFNDAASVILPECLWSSP